jgi:hypothetical protein
MQNDQEFFERRIVTGLIVSKDYLERVQKFWDHSLLESPELRTVAQWCLDYFQKYNKAPDSNIQDLYMDALKSGKLSKADASYIEEMLTGLSNEYGRGTQFNSAYLYDQTVKYFKSLELERHNREVQALVDTGQIEEAEVLAASYTPSILNDVEVGLELSSEDALAAVERAFNSAYTPVVSYPGALGDMWNEHLIRGGFVSLLAPEKRGKSWMQMEIALRAIRQKANVAFFEAGDMTESQVLRRICIYIAQRSDKEKYCQERFRPVGDCVLNQLDICSREDRNCDYGIFDMSMESFYQSQENHITLENLMEKYEEFPDYAPCDSHNCTQRRGSVWLTKVNKKKPLTSTQAKKKLVDFFQRYRRRFKLATYPAGFLTVSEIRMVLNNWERHDGFVPDCVVVDYADLLSADDGKISEFRHRQDYVWKALRALSQERHVLVFTATQADADSYKRGRLSLSNFSEDKRKLSHVTAQFGLNQDVAGREKKLGIMRINQIVVREGDFSPDNEVYVLQDLAIGRPYLESFFEVATPNSGLNN